MRTLLTTLAASLLLTHSKASVEIDGIEVLDLPETPQNEWEPSTGLKMLGDDLQDKYEEFDIVDGFGNNIHKTVHTHYEDGYEIQDVSLDSELPFSEGEIEELMEQIILEQIFAEMFMPHVGIPQFDAGIDGIFADMDFGDSDLDFYNDPDLFDSFYNAMLEDDDYDSYFIFEEYGPGDLDEIPEVLEQYEIEEYLPMEEPKRMLLGEKDSFEEEQTVKEAQSTAGYSPIWGLSIIFALGLAYGISQNIFDTKAFVSKKKRAKRENQDQEAISLTTVTN